MLVLALPRDVVEAALVPVERRLARRPDAWSNLAARGKLRRLLGDRGGLDDLRTAADTYLRLAGDPTLLTPANLYRLAGDDRARTVLEQLRAGLAAESAQDGASSMTTGMLVDTCFLLGDDAGAQEAVAAMERDGPAGLRHGAVAQLAAGRAAHDVTQIDETVAALDAELRAQRRPFAGTGGMNVHDWLEISLVTRFEVTGEPSDRLVTL